MLEYHKFACEGLNSTRETFLMPESELVSSSYHKEDRSSAGSSFNSCVDQDANSVQCPLCQLSFNINIIESHAATCGE